MSSDETATQEETLFSAVEPDALPVGLTAAIEAGKCVLFVGAGVGQHARDSEGHPAADSERLALEIAARFEIEVADDIDLATISRIAELRKGRTELEAVVAERLAGLEPDDVLQWLYSMPWRAIFTTNYDAVIERAFELNPKPIRNPVVMSASADLTVYDPRYDIPIYHLHGSIAETSRRRILITDEDYALFHEKRRMLFEVFRHELATSPILYIGYSNRDPNWKMVDAELRAEFAPSSPPRSYRVVPKTDPLQRELLSAQGIEAVDRTVERFVADLQSALQGIELSPQMLEQARPDVPSDLQDEFEQAPAAVARLLRGWTYVNQAPFHAEPNTKDFLLGDRPNWALIGAAVPFERDIEETLFERLIDFATDQDERTRGVILLGSAGYGVSTVLMRLAVRLATERAGRVFFHRAGLPINEGDVLFASETSDLPAFFVVDNASDEADRLAALIQRLRDQGVTAYFLLGDRLNEWRQRRARLNLQEFEVLPLSDAEIDRLLAFLDGQRALNKLADLSPELRVAAIREKHEKQLLVAMREATEGRAFDAIIEDEYRSIASDFGRQVYASVCGFYRFRTSIRDSVLADVVGRNLAVLYEALGTATEGVVLFELLDPATGTYAARARHQTIAEIVWERGVEPGEREAILLGALAALNLNYHIDNQAFDTLVRSDSTVDGLATFEGKVRFFDAAAAKDPLSPYVHQHYARMLLRERKLELALAQIDRALSIDEGGHVLHHTKGVILREFALSIESLEIARRRLVQSEAEFRRNISRDDRDEYSYQSLAELYLGWAERAETDDETVAYVAKATEVVTEGLRRVRNREGLHIVLASVERFLGNRPESLEQLRRAVASAPGSVVAPYLLGRELRRAGKPEDAAAVLHEVLQAHPDEVGAAIQYALALEELGKPYAESIAVLRLASLYGMRSPRFVAMLGGMLFMDGKFTEAEAVWSDGGAQNFTFGERSAAEYFPRDRASGDRIFLTGEVATVRPGFAFIRVPGYPDVFVPGSKFGKLVMERGLRVKFKVAFTARGPVALEPTAV